MAGGMGLGAGHPGLMRPPAAVVPMAPPMPVNYQPPVLSSAALRGGPLPVGPERAACRPAWPLAALPCPRTAGPTPGPAAELLGPLLGWLPLGPCPFYLPWLQAQHWLPPLPGPYLCGPLLTCLSFPVRASVPPPQGCRRRRTGCGCTSTLRASAPLPACSCTLTSPAASVAAPGEWASRQPAGRPAGGARPAPLQQLFPAGLAHARTPCRPQIPLLLLQKLLSLAPPRMRSALQGRGVC